MGRFIEACHWRSKVQPVQGGWTLRSALTIFSSARESQLCGEKRIECMMEDTLDIIKSWLKPIFGYLRKSRRVDLGRFERRVDGLRRNKQPKSISITSTTRDRASIYFQSPYLDRRMLLHKARYLALQRRLLLHLQTAFMPRKPRDRPDAREHPYSRHSQRTANNHR